MSMDERTRKIFEKTLESGEKILTARWSDDGVALEINTNGAKLVSVWLALGIAIQETMKFEASGAFKDIFLEDGSFDTKLAAIMMSVIARVVREESQPKAPPRPRPSVSVQGMGHLDPTTIALLKLLAMASPATGDN